MAQSEAPPHWGRQWSPQHQNGEYVMMDPRTMNYDQQVTSSAASMPRSMMPPPYMMGAPFSQGPMTGNSAPQYPSQPPPMAYSPYTSSPTGLVSPFPGQLRYPSADSEHSPISSHQESSRCGSVPSSRTLSTTSDNRSATQNEKSTTVSIPGVYKTVAPIVTAVPQATADTCVDRLMKVIQALPETNHIIAKVEEGMKEEFEMEKIKREGSVGPAQNLSPTPNEKRDLSKLGRKKEKKFWCDWPGCQSGFAQRPHLTIHRRSHENERPYPCRYCAKWFTQTANRKSHESTHFDDRPFACELGCGKTFRQRSTANAHLKTHSPVRDFVCKLCETEKRFGNRGNLKTHVVKFHDTEVRQFQDRCASITRIDDLPEDERDLFVYFATVFKNLNKGIKGRGKGKDKNMAVVDMGSVMTTPPATNSSCASSTTTSPMSMQAPGRMHFADPQQQNHHTQLPVINFHAQHPQQPHFPPHHHDGHFQHHQHRQTPPTHGLPHAYVLPPPLVTSIPMAYEVHSAGSTPGGCTELAFGDRMYH